MNYNPAKVAMMRPVSNADHPLHPVGSSSSSRRVPPPPPPRTGRAAPSASARIHLKALAKENHNPLLSAVPVGSVTAATPAPSLASVGGMHSQGYLETRYAFSVNGILGSAAQASAAAAFFARASQKLNLASPQRRKRHGSSSDGGTESPVPSGSPAHRQQRHHFGTDFCGLLRRSPPPPPARLLHRLGTREKSGVGKVRVMLRVSGDPSQGYLSVDKKRKQLTLQEPQQHQSDHHLQSAADDRRVGVSAPKMFAFDGLFTQDDTQADVASSVLSDIVTAVINGSDGCVFCYGHAQLGKTSTIVGTSSTEGDQSGPGLIPTAIAWLFRGIAEQKSKTGARFSVRVSAVEIAGPAEILRDLLAPHATESEESPGVYLRDDPLLGTQLQNQSELRAPTAEKAAFYLDAALAARTDPQSPDARFSHLLYTLHVYQYSVDRTPGKNSMSSGSSAGVAGGRSRLHLLDLGSCQTIRSASAAASHSSSVSNAMTLSGLGNVLVALFNGQRHLPHREHKITQVLRECLGSLTCQAALIAHVAATSVYSETLATVQMASRVHRMRRRRVKPYNNGGSGGSGSGGSSEESSRLGGGLTRSSGGESGGSTSADPSSSEQSCDTVIYVGPIDDATDGEHPPVYLPSLNSGDQRCSMTRALRGSSVDSNRAVAPVSKKAPVDQPQRSPQVQRKATAKCDPAGTSSQQPQPAAVPNTKEEQWIDGPRFNKTRISQARMQVVRHQREMWVDGPTASSGGNVITPAPTATPLLPTASQGYGFMDHHKQGMIRQWVETQSAQQLRHATTRTNGQAWIDAQPRPAPEPGTAVKVLTVFKTCPDEEEDGEMLPAKSLDATSNAQPGEMTSNARSSPSRTSKSRPETKPTKLPSFEAEAVEDKKLLNALSGESGGTATTATSTALTLDQLYSQCEQLADSLCRQSDDGADARSTEDEGASDDLSATLLDVTSEQVSVSCDSWRRVSRHHQTIQEESDDQASSSGGCKTGPTNGRGGDYSPEYIEVEEPDEPVPTQDSCLQVTEEDIALSMMNGEEDCGDSREHPLRALSTDNLTVISHFTGETYSQGTASEWEPINSIFDPVTGGLHNDFYQTQLEQLAKLHQQIYPAVEESDKNDGELHPPPLSVLTTNNIGSFKDLPLLSQDWKNHPAGSRNGVIKEPNRKTLAVSTIGLELERELGIQDAAQQSLNHHRNNRMISSLRHPDGASDPHLDQHEILLHPCSERLPGNGAASTCDPKESGDAKPASVVMTATNVEEPVMSPAPKPAKTPKLSRFFGSKNKRNTCSVGAGGSPVLQPKSSSSSSAKGSPKPERRSSAKNSPVKTSSKSPCRIVENSSSPSIPPSPKSAKSGSSGGLMKKEGNMKLKSSSSAHKSPKRDATKSSWMDASKRDVKSYGFSYEGVHHHHHHHHNGHHHHQQTAPSSFCPSEGYESGGSDSGVQVMTGSPIKMMNSRHQTHHQQQQRRPVLMPSIGELPRNKTFSSSGTSTSGSGGSGGHYESSGYESVMRDSECSSLGSSSQDSDRSGGLGTVPTTLALAVIPGKPEAIGHSSSCTIL